LLILQSYPNLPILQENVEKSADVKLSKVSLPKAKFMILIDKFEGFKTAEAFFGKELDRDTRQVRRYKVELKDAGLIDFSQRPGYKYEACTYWLTDLGKQLLPDIFTRYKNLTYYKLHIAPFVNDDIGVQKNVLPNSYLAENYISKTGPDRKHVYAGTPARDKVTASKEDCSKKVSKRKESRMELPDIPEHIQIAARKLGLNLTGQLKLMSFTQATVEHGLDQVKHMKSSKDVYKNLMEVCKQFAAANGEPIDWQPYLRLAEQNPDKINKLGPFMVSKAGYVPSSGSVAAPKPYVPNPDLQKKVKEQAMAKQKSWEATKTEKELKHRLEEGKQILQALNIKQISLTDEQKRSIDTKRETIAKFESMGNLDPIRQMILDNWKQELKELEALYEPKWPQDVQDNIDWFKQYVRTRTVTQAAWKPVLDRIEEGPTGTWAVSGQLQQALHWMRYEASGGTEFGAVVTEPKSRIDSASKEEPVELIDEDQAFDEV
jgi:hypothetical protein